MAGTIVDMHLHTTRGASDSMLDPEDLIAEANRIGLTGVNITEHDRMWESWDLNPFRKAHPETFISNGMEVSTDMGHVIAVGLRGYESGIRRLERLREVADEQGAYLIGGPPLPSLLRSRPLQAPGEARLHPHPRGGGEAARLPARRRRRGAQRLQPPPARTTSPCRSRRRWASPEPAAPTPTPTRASAISASSSTRPSETPEHFLSLLHRGAFNPVRGLPQGELENFWDAPPPEEVPA